MKNIVNRLGSSLRAGFETVKEGFNAVVDGVKEAGNKALALVGLGGAAAASTSTALATDPTYPDPSAIYTGLATPFSSALTWVIGAIAVLAVIGWIRKAIRK